MGSAETREPYSQTLWMQHFSIRLMQLHHGMHASLAMKLAADAWHEAHERDPEEVARELDEAWLAGHVGVPVRNVPREVRVARCR